MLRAEHVATIELREQSVQHDVDFVPDDPAGARRTLQLHFVEGDPLDAWDRYRDLTTKLEASGTGRIVFAAPFVATEVGTDRYVDEIW